MANDKLRKQIIAFFYNKIPNALLPDHIANGLGVNKDEIEIILKDLLKERIIKNGVESKHYPHRITYNLVNEPKYFPIIEHIQIGEYSIPRMLDLDIGRAEDINQLVESMHKYTSKMEDVFRRKLENQIKRFYGNLVAIFGVFIAVFSLIISAVNISSNLVPKQNIREALIISCAIYLPLIVVLFILILLIGLLNKTILKSE